MKEAKKKLVKDEGRRARQSMVRRDSGESVVDCVLERGSRAKGAVPLLVGERIEKVEGA